MEKEQERYLVKHCMRDVDYEITACTHEEEMSRKQLGRHIGWLTFWIYKKKLLRGITLRIEKEYFMGRHPTFELIKLITEED